MRPPPPQSPFMLGSDLGGLAASVLGVGGGSLGEGGLGLDGDLFSSFLLPSGLSLLDDDGPDGEPRLHMHQQQQRESDIDSLLRTM